MEKKSALVNWSLGKAEKEREVFTIFSRFPCVNKACIEEVGDIQKD
jgi:hypothetical protein